MARLWILAALAAATNAASFRSRGFEASRCPRGQLIQYKDGCDDPELAARHPDICTQKRKHNNRRHKRQSDDDEGSHCRATADCFCLGGIVDQELFADGYCLCGSCNEGYWMDTENDACELNKCLCANGEGAKGPDCAVHEGFMCASCDEGFALENGECVAVQKNICICHNGTPVAGDACHSDGAEVCHSCNDSHFLNEGKTCSANVCTCSNGSPASGAACLSNSQHSCESCDEGFELADDGFCVVIAVPILPKETKRAHVCTCSHGEAVTSENCPTDGANICETCHSGHFLNESKVCQQNQCRCPNGIPQSGKDCAEHDSLGCNWCDSGYDKIDNECVLKECICLHGAAAIGEDCPESGESYCIGCSNDGFHLDDFKV